MTHAYILLSIGPVQSAISQARRTQDLFMGSRLLSLLRQAAIEGVPDTARIIYPAVERDATSIPNHILLHCAEEEAASLAERLSEFVHDRWHSIGDRTHRQFEAEFLASDPHIWERQVTNWLEVYTVVVPDTGNYKHDNGEANRLLAARKLTRDFAAADEPGHKCSLTGEHEALHAKASGSAGVDDVRQFWDMVRQKQRNLAILGKGERLCALSLIKRFAHEAVPQLMPNGRFSSTSSIASAPFRASLLRNWEACKTLVATYLSALEQLFDNSGVSWEDLYFHRDNQLNPERFPYLDRLTEGIDDTANNNLLTAFRSLDGDFLYEEGMQAASIKEYTRSATTSSASALQPALEALKTLHKQMKEQYGTQPPSDYLAVLSMDGDHMGEFASNFERRDEHTAFSQRLAAFAQDVVRPTVEDEFPGRLVYAGGDDVLALFPAEDALRAAEALRSRFAAAFATAELHVSIGIAFIHRTYPLQAAVRAAKDAQERAKNEYGRNAVAVALLQRSGEPHYMGMRWEVPHAGQIINLVDTLQEVVNAMASDALSRSLPYDIEHVIYSLVSDTMPVLARWKEFVRMFKRRCKQVSGDQENPLCTDKDDRDKPSLCQRLADLAEYGLQNAHDDADPVRGWEDLARWLRLARFLAGEASERVALS